MTLRKIAVSGAKWSMVGAIGSSLFQLIQISILTRFLPKEAFGLVAMALFVVQFTNVFLDMGMTSAILHRQNSSSKEYSSIYWLNIFISIFLYVVLVLSSPSIAHFYEETEIRLLLPVLGINLLFVALGRQHRTIMQKKFQFRVIAITDLISFSSGLGVAIILAINNFGVYSLVFSTLAASLISNALFLMLNLRQNPIHFHFCLREVRPFLKIGGFSMGSTLLDFFSRETDVLIIGKMLGAESLGLYSLSKQIVIKLFRIINPVVVNVLSPLLSVIQKDRAKLKSSYLKVVKYLALINFPIFLVLIVISKELLLLLYGSEYIGGSVVLVFLAVAYCLAGLSNPVGSLQIATGRTDIGFKWTVFRVMISPIFIFIGALFDIGTVAALYALLSLILIVPLWYVQLWPMGQIRLLEYLQQFYKPFLFFAGVIIISKLNVFDFHSFDSAVGSAIIKIGAIIFLYSIYIFVFDYKTIKELSVNRQYFRI